MDKSELDNLYAEYQKGTVSWDDYSNAVRSAIENVDKYATSMNIQNEAMSDVWTDSSIHGQREIRAAQSIKNMIDRKTASLRTAMIEHVKRVDSIEGKFCKKCGKPIGKARLDAMPGTNICAKCLRPDMEEEDHDLVENIFNDDNMSSDNKKIILQKNAEANKKLENIAIEIQRRVAEQLQSERKRFNEERADLEYQKDLQAQKMKEKIQSEHSEKIKRLFIENACMKIKNEEIFLYFNKSQYNERSPILKGCACLGTKKYDVSVWKHTNKDNEPYYAGYLNINVTDQNNRITQRQVAGKIGLKKRQSLLYGSIVINEARYSIYELQGIYEESMDLHYWRGQIKKRCAPDEDVPF